jgi:hypothetical protein
MPERCDSCRLWRRLTETGGECHALAPAPVLYDSGVPSTAPPPGGLRVAWPVTDASAFCGEWCPLPVRPQRPDRPRVVVLCGSTRFGDAYRDAMRSETLAGRIVLTVGLLGHAEGIDMDGPVKAMLDELHLRKIDLADEVLVLNPRAPVCEACRKPAAPGPVLLPTGCCRASLVWRPYVGASTRREIAYAVAHGKPVHYPEPPEGVPT